MLIFYSKVTQKGYVFSHGNYGNDGNIQWQYFSNAFDNIITMIILTTQTLSSVFTKSRFLSVFIFKAYFFCDKKKSLTDTDP